MISNIHSLEKYMTDPPGIAWVHLENTWSSVTVHRKALNALGELLRTNPMGIE